MNGSVEYRALNVGFIPTNDPGWGSIRQRAKTHGSALTSYVVATPFSSTRNGGPLWRPAELAIYPAWLMEPVRSHSAASSC
jgi:hypothetical protein